MKKLFLSSLVMLVCGSSFGSLAQAAEVAPSVAGSWKITFFLENSRSTGATQCVVFKSVPGTVAGVPTSGTWSSPSFPGWVGQWVQLGDHVRWFGVTSSQASGLATTESGNIENIRNFGGVSFNHFSKTNGATSTAGSWVGVRVTSCTTDNVIYANEGDDPSSKGR